MNFLKLSTEHAEAVHNVDLECFSQPWSVNIVETLLKSDTACVFGAFDDSKLVGYVALEWVLDEGSLTNLAVLPDYRRKGLAQMLTEELLRKASEQNLSFVTLEVRVSNTPAISLYHKLKFTQVGKRPGYYSAPVEDALLMTRYLK